MQSSLDEREAVARLKHGDLGGLEVLLALHQTMAQRTAYLILGDRSAAEDVAIEAFLDANAAIARFDGQRAFGPWLHRIVVNRALTTARKARRSSGDHALERLPSPEPLPAQAAETRDAHERIWAAVQALPVEERTVVVLFYYLDHDLAEIAAVMACPLGTVKWRLHAARKRLAPALEAFNPAVLTRLDTTGGLIP